MNLIGKPKYPEPAYKTERWADPEVTVFALKGDSPTVLDYGWHPEFSPSAEKLVYWHQTSPISGFRALRATLAGNAIRVYSFPSRQTLKLPSPDRDHDYFPLGFLNEDQLVLQVDDKRGDTERTVAIIAYDLQTKTTTDLVSRQFLTDTPARYFNLSYNGKNFTAMRRVSPNEWDDASGTTSLIRHNGERLRELYSWSEQGAYTAGFHIATTGKTFVHDEGWRDLANPSRLLVPPPKSIRNEEVGVPSPDGRHVLQWTSTTLYLYSLTDHSASLPQPDKRPPIWQTEMPGRGAEATWSKNSRRFALVSSVPDPEFLKHAEVRIYELPD